MSTRSGPGQLLELVFAPILPTQDVWCARPARGHSLKGPGRSKSQDCGSCPNRSRRPPEGPEGPEGRFRTPRCPVLRGFDPDTMLGTKTSCAQEKTSHLSSSCPFWVRSLQAQAASYTSNYFHMKMAASENRHILAAG